jgi:hypothetical protein
MREARFHAALGVAQLPDPRSVTSDKGVGQEPSNRLRQDEGGSMSKRRKRPSTGPYVGVPKSIWEAPAWREMSPEARLLWIDLRGRLRNDCLNNGNVHRSCRTAAKSLGLSKNTITRRFGELEHYGFLHKTSEGFLGADGRGIAAKYRFTDLAHGTHPATRRFGAPPASVILRRGETQMEYDNRNRGALFRNDDKDPNNDKERDYSGTLDVGGEEFWVSGWVKTSKAGKKYLSLSVKPKVEKPAAGERKLRADDFADEIPF